MESLTRRRSSTRIRDLRRTPTVIVALLACLAGCLLASAPAFATFSRPFLGDIKGTTAGPFEYVGGIATAPSSGNCEPDYGHLWIGDYGTGLVDEFGPSNEFLASLSGYQPYSLAFDQKSCKLESAGSPASKSEWVATDNSPSLSDPATGDVYQAFSGAGSGEHSHISRVTSADVPAPFTCPEGIADGYITNGELIGTGKLIGTEHEVWNEKILPPVAGIAVDSSSDTGVDHTSGGDIYVLNTENLPDYEDEIDQFTPEGCFVRAITGTPSEPFGHEGLKGVAVDSTNGDMVVVADAGRQSVVDEFTWEGKYLGQIVGTPGEPFPELLFSDGIAVNSSGDLYVDMDNVVDGFGPGAFFPAAVTGEVEDDRPTSAVVTGVFRGIANADGKDLVVSGCDFEVVAEAAFEASEFGTAKTLPCVLESGAHPEGKAFEEKNYYVHAEASGLTEGETYEYRLTVTTDPSEHGGTKDGAVESFTAAAAPVVRGVSVGNISSSFADFSGEVDPRGSDTTYQFQYVDAADYEAGLAEHASDPYAAGASVPVPSADIGSGERYVSVSVPAGGLAADTAYYYRVVASNGVNVTDGAGGVFATLPAGLQGLPDHRAYELVTPANKGDAEDMFGRVERVSGYVYNEDVGYASEDGNCFLLWSQAAFGPFPASGGDGYVFCRSADGWSFKSVVSPSLGVQNVGNLIFDPLDLSMVGVEDHVSAEQKKTTVDLYGPAGGPYTTTVAAGAGGEGESLQPVAGATNLSDVALESGDHKQPLCSVGEERLEGELDEGSNEVYEWSSERGCLSLVDLRPGSSKPQLVNACGATLGLRSGGIEGPGGAHNAVSANGSEIFFTAPAPFDTSNAGASGKGCWNGAAGSPPQLYMRVDGETTVKVSEPAHGLTPEGVYPAIYVGAATDGSRVFFMTKTQLTPDASAIKTRGEELYEYDALAPEGKRLVRISRGDLSAGPVEGKVLDVPAVAEDGSTVYFNAEGNLTPGAHSGGLYRYDTETGETTYVAEMQPYPNVKSARIGEKIYATWYEDETRDLIAGLDLEAPYYATRNGRFLLFGSHRYDAADGSTVCVLCNPNGSGPIPGASFNRSAPESNNPAGGPIKAMSENGEYVFFDTAEPLVPQATNGEIDVYEWHDGSINLISSGQSSSADFFLGSSSCVNPKGEAVEGCNVFFGTHSQLVPADTDNSGDLYDARIDGGFTTVTGTGLCEGDACDNPPPAPVFQTPASVTVTGSGNLAGGRELGRREPNSGAKCKRGFLKKKNKCVRSKSKKKAKKSSRGRWR